MSDTLNINNNIKKAVIITGASGGIGASIAEMLAESYNLILIYGNNKDKAEVLGELCMKHGAEVMLAQCDVANFEACEKVVKQSVEKFGGIYGLVNNAGITRDSLLMRMTEEQFDLVIDVNLKSVFNMCKASVPFMTKSREGRIVNISSVIGIYGNAGQTNYAASKAGIIGFTKSLAKEIGSRNITVNAIAPGYIVTDMTAKMSEQAAEEIKSKIAMKFLGEPKDVAYCVNFLMHEMAARYITGSVMSVDGGISL